MNGNLELLKCQDVCAGYGASQVLFDVSLDVRPGEVIGLLGRNGMGKTTTIRSLLGVIPTMRGKISFDGQKIDGLRPDTIARRGIAIVPEGRMCFPNLTVHEHLIAFSRSARSQADSKAKLLWDAERLYKLFPRLAERRRNFGNQLSGGEQQMLAIARALSTQPKLLILDEATEGLAPLIREEIWTCLALLRSEGQTTLVVDKYVEKLLKLADRHVILEKGSAVWKGASRELSEDRSLWTRYLGI